MIIKTSAFHPLQKFKRGVEVGGLLRPLSHLRRPTVGLLKGPSRNQLSKGSGLGFGKSLHLLLEIMPPIYTAPSETVPKNSVEIASFLLNSTSSGIQSPPSRPKNQGQAPVL